MTQKEFSKQVKAFQKKLDDSMVEVLKGTKSAEEHLKLHKEWRDLCKFAKDNNLYVQ